MTEGLRFPEPLVTSRPPAYLHRVSTPFNCRTFRRHFSAWRDGDPSAPDEAMHEHVGACGRCASIARALDVGVRVLRANELAWPTSPSMPFIAP